MVTLRLDPTAPDPAAIDRAAEVLRRGGLVAFPTETVYGLGADALNERAVRRIFSAKGRPAYNPLIVHVPDVRAARALASEWPAAAERLASAYWPGPLTLVLPKRPVVPDLVTAGLPAVALRVPSHPVALALLRAFGRPVAAPSANRSTEVSPTTAAHVRKGLGDRVDLILDAGSTPVGIESTVVDLSGEEPALLRPGLLPAGSLEELAGPLQGPGATAGDAPRRSPGLLERHYAPRAEARLVENAEAAVRHLAAGGETGRPTGAVLRTFPDLPVDHLIRLPADPAGYARGLYAALHTMDDLGCRTVLIEPVPADGMWAGVRDRLARATHA